VRRVGKGFVDVRFGWKCIDVIDDPYSNSVKVKACKSTRAGSSAENGKLGEEKDQEGEKGDEEIVIEASYVLGTDGTNSSVRRALGIPFEGFTHSDLKMLGTDTLFDFTGIKGWGPLNFFVGEEEWGVVAFTGQNGDGEDTRPLWRIAFGEDIDLSERKEDVFERARTRIKKLLERGGKVEAGKEDFVVVKAESYFLHQRCAAQAKKGRVMLAGDALHASDIPLIK